MGNFEKNVSENNASSKRGLTWKREKLMEVWLSKVRGGGGRVEKVLKRTDKQDYKGLL